MKKIIAIALVALMVVSLTGCGNAVLFDTTYTFHEAMVSLPSGELIKGKVTRWLDFDDSDMVQVEINGDIYLTHSSNVVLISHK